MIKFYSWHTFKGFLAIRDKNATTRGAIITAFYLFDFRNTNDSAANLNNSERKFARSTSKQMASSRASQNVIDPTKLIPIEFTFNIHVIFMFLVF